jgi:hypothetical protein
MAIGSVFVHANPIAAEPAIFQRQWAIDSMEANIGFPGAANSPAITSKIILSDMSVPQNPVRPVDEIREYPA